MKLDEEMRAAIKEAARGSAMRRDGTTSERIYMAGYRMGLERAAKVAQTKFERVHTYASENSDRYVAMRDAGDAIATAIREMAHD